MTDGSEPASTMTIRQAFAAMAMQGLLSNSAVLLGSGKHPDPNVAASDAVIFADALLAALAKGANDAQD